jgi:hypothetical protein
MNTEMLNLTSKGLENKRDVVLAAALNGLLDDMVTVLVLDASQNVLF